MTDRELLELAANAAGYKQYYSHWLGRDSFVTYEEEVYSEIKERRVVAEKTMDWDPLTDDGDAFRLAVKLGLTVYPPESDESFATVNPPDEDAPWVYEPVQGDPCAATRRAIVRAAAEIGRTMK